MFTIKENLECSIIIKKSKFISRCFRVNTLKDVNDLLNKLKLEYLGASCFCYAYVIDNTFKYSDDKEPSNAAGLPIYNILKYNNLNYILSVVIRYYGGIKLGVGPLTRAYKDCASKVLKNNIVNLIDGFLIEIKESYKKEKILNIILKDCFYLNKNYTKELYYLVNVKKDLILLLDKYNIKYQIIKKIKLEEL